MHTSGSRARCDPVRSLIAQGCFKKGAGIKLLESMTWGVSSWLDNRARRTEGQYTGVDVCRITSSVCILQCRGGVHGDRENDSVFEACFVHVVALRMIYFSTLTASTAVGRTKQ